jgi:hypothetical protein
MRSRDVLEQQYPALWQFLGAYLHQDWRDEYESTSAALADFVNGTRTLAADLPREIDDVLVAATDDAALEQLLVDIGSFFVPSRVDMGPRDWLRQMKDEAQFLLTQAN